MLTLHQRKHVLALRVDAADLVRSVDRVRVRREADDLLTERVAWPISLRRPYAIHDFFESKDVE